jgi:hypothetical protein
VISTAAQILCRITLKPKKLICTFNEGSGFSVLVVRAKFCRTHGAQHSMGNPWRFKSTPVNRWQAASFDNSSTDAGGRHMKAKMFTTIALVTLSLMIISGASVLQAGDEGNTPTLTGSRPRMEPQIPVSPCYYCVERDNPVLWKWHVQNSLSDIDAITRSYLNPESDLDYMLRTY